MKFAGLFAALAWACSAQAAAPEIRITEGPVDYQVLQRNSDGCASLTIKGTASGKKINGKAIQGRVLGSNGAIGGFDWRTVGQTQKLGWTAEFDRIPTGGPYRLELRLEDTSASASVDHLLVGDLWVLAGQSNMEGVGDLVDVQQPDPMVHTFDLADRWAVAEEPLHTLVNAADRIHWRQNAQGEPERLTGEVLQQYIQERKKGAGLGLPFAVIMARRTGIPIGLIPCAHGGTSMDQWNPALKERGGDSLYGSMYRRFRLAGGHVKGMLWYQGESDANPKSAPEFLRKFVNFVAAVRTDFAEPDLPFYYVQIGRHISNTNQMEWNQIQEAQLDAETQIPHSGMVVSVDLELDDSIHVGTADLKLLARRLADRVSHDLFPKVNGYGELRSGPRPVSAHYANGIVRVTFRDVNDRLVSQGRLSGFSIHNAEGQTVALIFRAGIDSAEASTVLLHLTGTPPEKATVWYGFGKDPYCNLHDTDDMAVPAFGPMPIQLDKPTT